MKIKGVNPDTGEEFTDEVRDSSEEELSEERQTSNPDVSADAQMHSGEKASKDRHVGGTIQKIYEVAKKVVCAIPMTILGGIIAFFGGRWLATVPIIGRFLKPLFRVWAIGSGFKADLDKTKRGKEDD